ncbi:hypothetical protein pb186bvf_017266 [Paramecium bursaria]
MILKYSKLNQLRNLMKQIDKNGLVVNFLLTRARNLTIFYAEYLQQVINQN